MLSQEAERVRAELARRRAAALTAPPLTTWAERRASAETFADWAAEPEGVTFEQIDAGGFPAILTTPESIGSRVLIVFTHGSGYAMGSALSHRPLVGHLAKATGAICINFDYPQPPEHPFPAPGDAVADVVRWARQNYPGQPIVLVGDSAGGALSAGVSLRLRDGGEPVDGLVMFGPWLDQTLAGTTIVSNAESDLRVNAGALRMMRTAYHGDLETEHPEVSPLYGDLEGMPPVLLQVGSIEMLLDDARRFIAKAQAAGVDATLQVADDMQHVWQGSAGRMPEADEALAEVSEWLITRWGSAAGR